jgi:cytochrome o ubiquinol oxidase subunit 2
MHACPSSASKRLPRLVVVPLLAAALAGCNMVVLDPTGDVAIQQRDLILIATGLMLLIIVPVLVLVVVFAWRYRRGGKGAYDPHFDHSTQLELVIWACPLLIIICLGAITWSSTHLLDPFRPLDRLARGRPIPPGTRTLEVQVVAMDWKWMFLFPEQGIATVNELALPVDTPVRFSITSTSQMNTFYAPTLAGMIYTMPGMQSRLHAVLNQPGDSWGSSANYTGAGFSDMRFQLIGLDRAGFDAWVAKVRSDGQPLTLDKYRELERPSEAVPAMRFASFDPDLYHRVLNRCVAEGRACLDQIMREDMTRNRGGMPASHEGMPAPGEKPTPALEKPAEEKGSGPNVTKPPAPGEQPRSEGGPERRHDRGMSAVLPASDPGALGAARG